MNHQSDNTVNYSVFDDTSLKSIFMENIRMILSGCADCLLTSLVFWEWYDCFIASDITLKDIDKTEYKSQQHT